MTAANEGGGGDLSRLHPPTRAARATVIGTIQFKLTGTEGQVFDLTVKCPEGHESPKQPVPVTLRKLADPKAVPEYLASCQPSLRTVVVAIRADNGPNLPVMYKGSKLATTDASGSAHLLLKVRPNQSLQVKLDTSEAKDLLPESPVQAFEVKHEDDVWVLDQPFHFQKKKRTYVPRGPRNTGPTAL
jgi:hypothetical protein